MKNSFKVKKCSLFIIHFLAMFLVLSYNSTYASSFIEIEKNILFIQIFCTCAYLVMLMLFTNMNLKKYISNWINLFIYIFFGFRFSLVIIGNFYNPFVTAVLDSVCFVFISSIFFGIVMPNHKKVKSTNSILDNYSSVHENEIINIGFTNSEILKDILFSKFVKIHTALSNYDYDTLRSLAAPHLYKIYEYGIDGLRKKGHKNIMSDFQLLNGKISKISNEENKIDITFVFETNYYNYVIDKKGNLKSGSKDKKITSTYEVCFSKSIDNTNLELKCKSCDAPIVNNSQGRCNYCGNIIDVNYDKWILVKKVKKQ